MTTPSTIADTRDTRNTAWPPVGCPGMPAAAGMPATGAAAAPGLASAACGLTAPGGSALFPAGPGAA
jgi:hypothetical protein